MQETPVRAENDSLEGYLSRYLTPAHRKRVLLVNFNHWIFAQGALADTALVLQSMGSEVLIALWANKTPMLDVAWTTSPTIASLLRHPSREQRMRTELQRLGLPRGNFLGPPIRFWTACEKITIPKVLSRTNIRQMRYRGSDLGRAILQTHPTKETPLTDDFHWPRKWVQKAARSYAFVYDQTLETIDNQGVTTVAVYNGRFLHDRAAAAAAEARGIPILSYDLGGLDTDFDLTIDETHDWAALQERMLKMYDSWNPAERDQLGSSWFLRRTEHKDPMNKLFVESQEIGKSIDLPSDQFKVVYFSSSGDEIAELDLSWDSYFGGQESALRVLTHECRQRNYYLVVRSHPHKRFKPKEDVAEWMAAIESIQPDVHLDPHADVDSYTLMREADVIVTYGSTTGVEAAFAHKPVIVMGPCAYDRLGAATGVSTTAELSRALESPTPGNWSGAVSYGLMMMRRGFNYNFVQRSAQETLMINGQIIGDSNQLVRNLSHLKAKIQKRNLL